MAEAFSYLNSNYFVLHAFFIAYKHLDAQEKKRHHYSCNILEYSLVVFITFHVATLDQRLDSLLYGSYLWLELTLELSGCV